MDCSLKVSCVTKGSKPTGFVSNVFLLDSLFRLFRTEWFLLTWCNTKLSRWYDICKMILGWIVYQIHKFNLIRNVISENNAKFNQIRNWKLTFKTCYKKAVVVRWLWYEWLRRAQKTRKVNKIYLHTTKTEVNKLFITTFFAR